VAPVRTPDGRHVHLCSWEGCRRVADDAFNTAPVFDFDTGEARVFTHCSWGHMAATMATDPAFADIGDDLRGGVPVDIWKADFMEAES
jgi:hypothetical protein